MFYENIFNLFLGLLLKPKNDNPMMVRKAQYFFQLPKWTAVNGYQ